MAKNDTKKRDTIVYVLKDGNEIVQYGVTSRDPCKRLKEHESDGKEFTHIREISGKMILENALKVEEENIKRYQSQHGGEPPRYNKNKTY